MIDRQVPHLARLVDDLLDVSRITRGKIAAARTSGSTWPRLVAAAVEDRRGLLDDARPGARRGAAAGARSG